MNYEMFVTIGNIYFISLLTDLPDIIISKPVWIFFNDNKNKLFFNSKHATISLMTCCCNRV